MTDKKSLSFARAIQATQSLIEKINAGQLNEDDIEQEVSAIVENVDGGRGFFVVYLTSKLSLPDRPSLGIIKGLRSSTEIISELLVKNLAMSSAMIVAHSRNKDFESIKGSQRVCKRTVHLIQEIRLDSISQKLEQLKATIINGKGEYSGFLERWEYDVEQKKAIQEAIASVLV